MAAASPMAAWPPSGPVTPAGLAIRAGSRPDRPRPGRVRAGRADDGRPACRTAGLAPSTGSRAAPGTRSTCWPPRPWTATAAMWANPAPSPPPTPGTPSAVPRRRPRRTAGHRTAAPRPSRSAAALARAQPKTFAALDDPYRIGRRLRPAIDGHRQILAHPPPDVTRTRHGPGRPPASRNRACRRPPRRRMLRGRGRQVWHWTAGPDRGWAGPPG